MDGAFKPREYPFISISTGRVPTATAATCLDQRLIWNWTHSPFYSSAKAYRQQIALSGLSSSWLDPSYFEFYQEVSHALPLLQNENVHPVRECLNFGYKVHADTHKRAKSTSAR